MNARRLCRFACSVAALTCAMQCSLLAAQPTSQSVRQSVPEYQLKAAFVYNFALFTDWPMGILTAGGTLNICVNPDSPLRPALSGLNDRQIKGRRVMVLQPVLSSGQRSNDAEMLRMCHVLVLDSLDRERWARIKKGLGTASVLTVSDDGEIGHDGAIIALYLDNNRVGFDVDVQAAKQAHLLLSSKLLRLARSVQ